MHVKKKESHMRLQLNGQKLILVSMQPSYVIYSWACQ